MDSDLEEDIINICSNKAASVEEIVNICKRKCGFCPEIKVDPKLVRVNEAKQVIGSNKILKKYSSAYDQFSIDSTIEWMLYSYIQSAYKGVSSRNDI